MFTIKVEWNLWNQLKTMRWFMAIHRIKISHQHRLESAENSTTFDNTNSLMNMSKTLQWNRPNNNYY